MKGLPMNLSAGVKLRNLSLLTESFPEQTEPEDLSIHSPKSCGSESQR